MKKNLTTILLVTSVISTACLFFTHGSSERHWKTQEQARVLQSGMTTCGQRMTQTFNAWSSLQNTSPYLNETFRADTEACYAEALLISREASVLQAVENNLNRVISDVHYLNTNMLLVNSAKFANAIEGAREDILERYNRFEEGADSIQAQLDAIALAAQADASSAKALAITFSALTFLSLIAIFINDKKKKQIQQSIEAQAFQLLTTELGRDSQLTSQLIESALESHDLSQTKILFQLSAQTIATHLTDNSQIGLSTPITKPQVAELNSDFSQIFTDVYEKMSSKVFANAIVCDIDLEAQTNVKNSIEDLIQLVHASMTYAINKLNPENKKLTIKTKRVADILFYRIHIPLTCFSADEMEINQGKTDDVSVELQLLAATAQELNASLQLKNRFSAQSGEISECVIEITLKAHTASEQVDTSRELTQVVRSTKRELTKKLTALEFNA